MLPPTVSPDSATQVSGSPDAEKDWAWALLFSTSLVGFPFVSLVPTLLGIPSRPISVAFRAAVLLLALGMLLRWVMGRRHMCSGPATWALVVFWLLLLGRITWEATVVPLPLNLVWNDYYLFGIGVALLPCLALLEVPSLATIRLSMRLTEFMGVPAVAGLALAGFNMVLSGEDESGRLGTQTVNAAFIGYLGVIVATVSAFTIVYGRRERRINFFGVAARIIIVLLGAVAMVASASKGPIVAGLIGAVLIVFLRSRREAGGGHLLPKVLMLCLMVALSVLAAFALEQFTAIRTVSRFADLFVDQSTLERTQMISGAYEQFARSPILGDDIVELRSQTYPHNMLLESLMTNGVIGFLLLATVGVVSLLAAVRLLQALDGREWLSVVYFQFWFLGLVAGSLVFTPHVWAMTAAVLSAGAVRRKTDV